MLVSFDAVVKQHLKLLSSFDKNVLTEFTRMSLNYINKGGRVGEKIYSSAANKLELDPDSVKNAIEALSNVFKVCAGYDLDSTDFVDSLITAGLNREAALTLVTFYLENVPHLRTALFEVASESGPSGVFPAYNDLEWRIQVEIASRALRNQFIPRVICKLKTATATTPTTDASRGSLEDALVFGDEADASEKTHLIEIAPRDLIHITQTLEEALREIRSSHARRVMRSVTST